MEKSPPPYLAYSSNLKMEAKYVSEMSVVFHGLHSVASKKIEFSNLLTADRMKIGRANRNTGLNPSLCFVHYKFHIT
jgi:hypothetical protein